MVLSWWLELLYYGSLGKEVSIDKPHVPIVCLVQEGTKLNQYETIMLKKVSFVIYEQFKCPLHNPFGDETFTPMHQPLDVDF